jgi:cytoskeleton protein RodZ
MVDVPDSDVGTTAERGGNDTVVGAQLRAARERLQLSVEDIASSLHLDAGMVEAIEENDRDRLPAPIFVQGYLRNYARLVGLSPETLVREYARRERREPPPLSSVMSAQQDLPRVVLALPRLLRNALLLMIALALIWWGYPHIERLIAARVSAPAEAPGQLELPLDRR